MKEDYFTKRRHSHHTTNKKRADYKAMVPNICGGRRKSYNADRKFYNADAPEIISISSRVMTA